MSVWFPLFVDLSQEKVLVVGAGRIASRRIKALLPFAGQITVIAPEASPEVQKFAQVGSVRYLQRSYIVGEIPGDTRLVLAASNCPEVNRAVYRECKEKAIPVNVSSEKELCDFYFPGIAREEDLVAGVTAGGRDHGLARRATESVRQALEAFVKEEKHITERMKSNGDDNKTQEA
ncbi:MAG: bifunctional precorrin-2 dehydrogenase/sirohydrochlorin ferrochelatase [Lachnospiraceae bacterium]|jgi:precorrin-2 dehydrogenase/sirohydrochlorin ferrochelatase|nr:bifunctional precorrin-2 dehydrogenase/sirohydrochlorin ferrochelatase [Lachnospiraceae bacterium]MCI8996279.1 bifunctional precorrin-2 dehydrogenase/sirohydrochlorin ferrochelatase [Lachnospiraceae bacterium]MCI9132826.1 bifunctional precorrin-2 dehydrogenase/sirohydrochlorin ferrochelatase [Lachnospiraceae bacterium]